MFWTDQTCIKVAEISNISQQTSEQTKQETINPARVSSSNKK